jgi:ribonucleoside-diphosphate reductase alpha chain
MYYLRSKAAAEPIKFTLSSKYQQKFVPQTTNQPVKTVETVDSKKTELVETAANSAEGIACSLDNPDECIMCGS